MIFDSRPVSKTKDVSFSHFCYFRMELTEADGVALVCVSTSGPPVASSPALRTFAISTVARPCLNRLICAAIFFSFLRCLL